MIKFLNTSVTKITMFGVFRS